VRGEESRRMKKKAARKKIRLPGDPSLKDAVARMIRVDHAGEFGAQRIYAGQLKVLGRGGAGAVATGKRTQSVRAIEKMARQEDEHLKAFEKLMIERRVRPTALHPLWHLAGFALGAATAALGEKAAMACTVAVEETIVEHYRKQIEALGEDEPALRKLIKKFRADEDAHRATGIESGAEDLPHYPILRALIRAGSKTAIWLSERI
jgi:3-demethoxyubiquinol 3-hydroxylase